MGKSTETLKHKPSKKVVLEDVLTSLQDLVNNEFADDSVSEPESRNQAPNVLGKSTQQQSTGPRKRGRPRKHPLPESQPRQQGKAESTEYTFSQDQGDLFGKAPAVEESIQPAKTPHAPVNGAGKPAKKPGDRTEKKPPAALETRGGRANLKVIKSPAPMPTDDTSEQEMNAKFANKAEDLAPRANLDWADDIPVLTEIVDPEELNFGELQNVVDQSLARKDLGPEAREIAVKVAARLNIEMRKSGGEQLDVKTIMRLQALLKEALEPRG